MATSATFLKKRKCAKCAPILCVSALKVRDRLFYQSNVGQHLGFCETLVRIVVSRMALLLHLDESMSKILDPLRELGKDFLLFAGRRRGSMI